MLFRKHSCSGTPQLTAVQPQGFFPQRKSQRLSGYHRCIGNQKADVS